MVDFSQTGPTSKRASKTRLGDGPNVSRLQGESPCRTISLGVEELAKLSQSKTGWSASRGIGWGQWGLAFRQFTRLVTRRQQFGEQGEEPESKLVQFLFLPYLKTESGGQINSSVPGR